ncbi:FAD-dependent monooxygenase [Candidatus Pelagibacter communis]|uniref:FAD-dependent monooxygenase n=1 Tax=Pelagibacter ubique TaxID=198252 RepID=UPI00094D2EF2|nr:FAD-dependent monooxygenase [Candidatus Pelagibacter ubique]
MKKIGIIGAGISGLYIANLFKKNPKYQVSIFDKKDSLNLNEGYGVQLSTNCVKFLNEIGFNKLEKNVKFYPEKINFYSKKYQDKICELDISAFNSNDSKYTTLKRSTLINFLKKDLEDLIKTNYSVSKIDQEQEKIKLTFENKETHECDYLIISDGVFSKSRNLVFNKQVQPKYNDTLAIRGMIPANSNIIDKKNILLFLGSDFHHVIYPVSSSEDLNLIAIMKYKLSTEEQKNFSLFSDKSFIQKILENIPQENKEFFNNLKELKIFPVFVSDNFFEVKNKNIHLIGDAFFAFPPSFAQGASQSIEGAHELFASIENNSNANFFKNRVIKTKMVNNRSKLNQFAFHLSNPLTVYFRNIFLKKLVKNKKFLESYLGKIYR